MIMRTRSARLGLVAASVFPSGAAAQSLGAFTWQLQPFCNKVTVNVVQTGAIYTLDGYDDQCNAPQRAPLVGLATPNPDGTIGLGFHIVTVPGGNSVSVEARITPRTYSGSWTDSARNSGTFAPGANAAGSGRPIPSAAPVWGTLMEAPTGADFPGLVLRRDALPSTVGAPGLVVAWGPPATFPSVGTAGVFSTSRDNVAILGASDTQTGVGGATRSGVGVGGISLTGEAVSGMSFDGGIGVHGTTDSGIGVLAETEIGAGGAALEVRSGAIKVSGAVRPAFTHVTSAANLVGPSSTRTVINHPLTNGSPTALLLVTRNSVASAGPSFWAHPMSVAYDAPPDDGRSGPTTSPRCQQVCSSRCS